MTNICPIEFTLAKINGKWKLLILKALSQGPIRYGALHSEITGVSAKVLTQQLKEMETDGLVLRTVFPEIPPRVEYSLTEMGTSIFTVFKEMRRWGIAEDKFNKTECVNCKSCQPYS
jgi:DNA-binding HxlR family transcriptional regulator